MASCRPFAVDCFLFPQSSCFEKWFLRLREHDAEFFHDLRMGEVIVERNAKINIQSNREENHCS
jgi:hypothetical protein